MLNKGAAPGTPSSNPPEVESTTPGSLADALATLPDTIDSAPPEESVGVEPAWLLLSAIAGGTLALLVGGLVAVLVFLLA